jgi:hypothetical protein
MHQEPIMVLLKSCSRCHGDVMGGLDGEFSCIQCGHELRPDERNQILVQLRLAQRQRIAAAAR